MMHTGPRTSASVLRYSIGVLNQLFTCDAGVWKFHPELVTPAIAADVGDLVGAANEADRRQYPGVPCPSGPDAPNPGPGPTPDPSDPFADLKLRQKVGSWAAFRFITRDESNTLKRTHPELANTLDQLAGYYGPGGWGNINGIRVGNDFLFDNFKTGQRDPDTHGAADAFILANSVSAQNPNGVAPPSLAIP